MSEPVSTISKESRAAIDTRFEKDSPRMWLRYSQGHREYEPMDIPIGRELYTAPFIWVPKESLQKHHEKNGRWQCGDKFHVKSVEIKDGSITDLSIANQFDIIVYQMHHKAPNTPKPNNHTPEDKTAPHTASEGRYERIRGLKAEAISLGISGEGIDKWIDTTFKGKAKKDLTDNEIKMAEAYLIGIIKDKRNGR